MSSLDHACDAVDLVAATVNAVVGVVEHGIFVEDLVNRSASTHRIVFTEHVVEITKQQGRYAVGHGFSPFGVVCDLRCRPRTALLRGGTLRDLSGPWHACLRDIAVRTYG